MTRFELEYRVIRVHRFDLLFTLLPRRALFHRAVHRRNTVLRPLTIRIVWCSFHR